MIDNRIVGKTVSTLRQARGLTQQQLAAALNVSHQAVSKWENGAALPDVQTLVNLAQLFGVTVEQLLSGELPENRPEEAAQEATPKSFGEIVSEAISDIGSFFRPADNNTVPADAEEPESPLEYEETADDGQEEQNVDFAKLLEMAPFMSRKALSDMLTRYKGTLTAAQIAGVAPFVDSDCLERLIVENSPEMNWAVLRRVAPFLKREVVDALTRAVVLGEKYTRPVISEAERAAERASVSLDDFGKKLERDFEKAVKKTVQFGENVVNEVRKVFDDRSVPSPTPEDRRTALRRSAFERALADGKWDWLQAHLYEITDEELLRKISDRAAELGMQDWIRTNLPGYADAQAVEEAVSACNWAWLGEHIHRFDPEMQQRAALAAMEAENWDWLSACSEGLDLTGCALEIADTARKHGEGELAVHMARCNVPIEQLQSLAMAAAGDGDEEFITDILDLLNPIGLCECCRMLGRSDHWESALSLAVHLAPAELENLMETAIEQGSFDAIDAIDALLNGEGPVIN